MRLEDIVTAIVNYKERAGNELSDTEILRTVEYLCMLLEKEISFKKVKKIVDSYLEKQNDKKL